MFRPFPHPVPGGALPPSRSGRPAARRGFGVWPLLLAAAVGACRDGVTAASVEPSGRPRTSTTTVAAAALPTPGDNSVNSGAVPLTDVHTTQAPGYYRITVQGYVTIGTSPAWASKPCTPNTATSAGARFGPAGNPSVAPGALFVELQLQPAGYGSFGHPLTVAPGDSGTAETKVSLGAGTVIRLRRSGIWGGGECPQGGFYSMYSLSGTQSVRVDKLDTSISVSADRREFLAADTLAFTSRAAETAFGHQWHFRAGDTLATPAGHGGTYVPGCYDKPVCRYAPGASGRMYVAARVPDGAQTAQSEVVHRVEPGLTLNCPASVQRGGTLNCTARARPSGATLQNVVWSFTDSMGNKFSPPAGTTSRWSGVMVVGGTMRVHADVAGIRVRDSAAVSVSARTWTSPVPQNDEFFMRCAEETPTCFQVYPPTELRHLGTRVTDPRGVSIAQLASTVNDSGPNHGWSYLSGDTSPIQFKRQLLVLNGILDPQNQDPIAIQFWSERPMCDRETVEAHVRKHERTHASEFVRNQSKVNEFVESQIAFVPDSVWNRWVGLNGPVALAIIDTISAASGSGHPAPPFDLTLPCDLKLAGELQ